MFAMIFALLFSTPNYSHPVENNELTCFESRTTVTCYTTSAPGPFAQ
jgi:hypothetical protein